MKYYVIVTARENMHKFINENPTINKHDLVNNFINIVMSAEREHQELLKELDKKEEVTK